ncbi:uncharacterized protein LOC8058040 [Sorghum bicolor]|uniref:uncharacterized protein LOC8058040 n=1 Tax=Sorghum bicolor TaxID=4558 RepID=UPI000B4248B3|nr:uncharacterized protein LOC8058040 [Sorghum bicolor]|eukprot:XP_002445741.2 uncharacterized protein LOC8058040 [Sorghum bicolor]
MASVLTPQSAPHGRTRHAPLGFLPAAGAALAPRRPCAVAAAAGSPSPPSLAASSSAPDSSLIRDLDSDAASLCSSRPATAGAGVGAAPNFSDRSTQAAALRVVNGFLAPAVTLRGASARRARHPGGAPSPRRGDDLDAPRGPSNDLLVYITQSYSHFLSGDAAAAAALDEPYASKARMTAEATGGRGEEALMADIQKFEAVANASQCEDDEAFARALQDAEERDVADRPMALVGIGDLIDGWEDVDPDEYSYEELIALGEVVGMESKGLAADTTIASLPSVTYQAQDKQDGNMEQCVICRVEFDEGGSLVALPCKHPYHSECINQWLQLKKVCPMCSAEVSTSVNKQA